MRVIFLISLLVVPFLGNGQQFAATGLITPIDLTGANGNCSSNGLISFNVPVTGVGSLSSLNALTQIHLTFSDCAGSGSNMNNVNVYVSAPDGTCTGIYDGGLSTDEDETVDFILTSSNGCLTSPNTANMPQESGQDLGASGSSGTFAATFPSGTQIDLTSVFNGVNADGVWTVIFSESTSFEPCIDAIELRFGDPTVDDMNGVGDDCVNAIVWDGSPICTTTTGASPSSQMPGWAGPGANDLGTFAGGVTCDWNFANNNDIWVEFVAEETEVCINISGLGDNLQSVVVSDPNTDGDNDPCTGANGGQYWTLESCPAPSIYSTTAGTDNNQNHCFTATVGQTYYLVVDGNGGAESSFYISGIAGVSYTLPVELVNFEVVCDDGWPRLIWETASELNNDYFVVEYTLDGYNFQDVAQVFGAGTTTSPKYYEYRITNSTYNEGYFRLKQVDYDGTAKYSSIIYAGCPSETPIVSLVNGQLIINSEEEILDCVIYDVFGRITFNSCEYETFRALNAQAVYYVHVRTRKGSSVHRVIDLKH